MTICAIFIDFGGVIVRTEDKEPRRRQAEKLGMTSRDLEKIIFESLSAQRASTGEITEDEHWNVVAKTLGLSREESDKITAEFFAGDRPDYALLNFLRSTRPERKVCLISNAWSGLRAFIIKQKFEDVFDAMIISAEVGVIKPDPQIYQMALAKLEAQPRESVFIDDVGLNVAAARAVGMTGIEFTQPAKALEELKQILNNYQ